MSSNLLIKHKMIEEDPIKALEESIPIVAKMGIKVVDFRKNYARLRLPIEGNTNHLGIAYAGSLFTVGELAGGAIYHAAFDTTRFYPIVKQISIRFVRMAVTDVYVEVRLSEDEVAGIVRRAEENDKSDFDLSLEIKDASGVVCSILDGIWQIRKNPDV
jgi:thioesterase domain-containing protein